MKTKFIILDWAGNNVITDMRFDSFDDAWEAIYDHFKDLDGNEFDAEMDEYQVIEVKN